MTKFSSEHITTNGRAAFYACVWPELKNIATGLGWALGLHGSLNSDMDLMAMPWTNESAPVKVLINAISDCFTNNEKVKRDNSIPFIDKPNGRVVYTIHIHADFYLDINIINPTLNLDL